MFKELDVITEFLTRPGIPDFKKAKEMLYQEKAVGWDLDQTLLATEYPVIGIFNRQFGTSYKPELATWKNNIKTWLVKDFGCDEQYAQYINNKFWWNPDYLSRAFPYGDAVELSLKLNKEPNLKEQFAVTSRKNPLPGFQQLMHDTTLTSMVKWYPWIPKENVFVDTLNGGAEYKVDTLKYLNKFRGLNVFIEDFDSNAYKIVEAIPDMWVILVSMESYLDQEFKSHPRILRLPTMKIANDLVAQSH